MSNNFTYQSNEFERQAQRFVIPLYIQDELGGYRFSSTATLARYNGRYYILMAAHALDGGASLEQFYFFQTDGQFFQLTEIASSHAVYKQDDLIVIGCFNVALDGKNYFNLNEDKLIGFEKNHFSWTGFPSSMCKTKKVHSSKSSEGLKQQFVTEEGGQIYFKSAKYFTIDSKFKGRNALNITGVYDRKNAELKYKGSVTTGPSPEGMSGGAMYQFAKGKKLKDSLDDSFRFIGIGVEYKKDNRIIGISKPRVISLIKQLEDNNPIDLEMHIFEPET